MTLIWVETNARQANGILTGLATLWDPPKASVSPTSSSLALQTHP